MKKPENNEMDLLLRSLAKQASSISDAGGGQQDAAHLDADELNAFAERTVPPAARARYTAHLADCSRCRKLVTALTAAAGLPIAEIKTEDQAQTSFWQRLPTFLSPAVLRFAVPALAMLAVVTLAVITFRQQRSVDYVAQNQEPAAQQLDSKRKPETIIEENQGQITTRSSPAPPSNSAPPMEKRDNTGEKAGAADKVTSADSTSGFIAKDAPKTDALKAGESQPKFANEPAPPPAALAQPAAKVEEANKNEVAKQQEGAAGATVARETRDERQAGEDRETDLSRSRKAAAAGRGGAAISSVEGRRAETEQKRADQDAGIREVAGRRFRKQANTWIDTGYDSARPAMTVVRGSEQYRALVSDEPSIRTIAERLAGEVIVVWKGRAYRIR